MFRKSSFLIVPQIVLLLALLAVAAACSAPDPTVVEVTREVSREVPVEVEVTRIVESATASPADVETDPQAVVAQPEPVLAEPREPIIFSDLDWHSVRLQNRIAQYIIEKGYDFPTETRFGSTLPLFQGLKSGDTHVAMEVWLPNQNEDWVTAQQQGAVVSAGESLGRDWQSAFVIPAYLQEQHPELDSVEDLMDPEFVDLFNGASSDGKAMLNSCPAGWACNGVNAAQVEGYGLTQHVDIVVPGDAVDLDEGLRTAYEKGEPWLGYQWGTNGPALQLDLVRLEEPAYSEECWFTTKACAYQDSTILIAVAPELPARAPGVMAMLRNWEFGLDSYREAVRWEEGNADAGVNDTAQWWLSNRGDVWEGWVTPEAADAVRSALTAGELPDGWPDR